MCRNRATKSRKKFHWNCPTTSANFRNYLSEYDKTFFFFVHTSWSSIYPTDNKTSQSSHDDVVMGALKYICWLYLSSSETRYHLTFLTGIFTTNNNSGNRQRSFEIWFWWPALVISSEKCAEKAVQNILREMMFPYQFSLDSTYSAVLAEYCMKVHIQPLAMNLSLRKVYLNVSFCIAWEDICLWHS